MTAKCAKERRRARRNNRLICAFSLASISTSEIRGKIARFIEGVSGFAPEARWVRTESLHITLKFIGEQKPEQVAAITQRLRQVASPPIEINMAGYGFFPTAKAPRVFWIGIHAGPQLAQVAE